MPKRYLFRGQHLTIAEAADMAGLSQNAIRARIRGNTIEDVARHPRGRQPVRYLFRGAWRTVREIATILGCHHTTVYERRSGDRVLEPHEIELSPLDPRPNDRRVTFKGITRNVAEWARFTGIDRHILYQRLDAGWTIERTLTTPVSPRRPTIILRMVTAFRRARNAHAIARMVEAFRAIDCTSPTRGVSETFPNASGTGGRSRVNDLH
ncbi:hypothetical protein [Pinisolibacter sp.]|uniref:hypothetical protein n=1 Tax=Pinisolibacter sp. TaxID=2172024 RepID=UPI002FDD0190